MKLIRLKINDYNGYKSLPQGFEIIFQKKLDQKSAIEFNPYILAGRNGSGKSNVLEVLAEIFYHLDCIYLRYKPDYFYKSEENPKGFVPEISKINDYELEYHTFLDKETFPNCDYSKIVRVSIIKKENKRPIIEWINESEFRKPSELSQQESKNLLPKFIVGYASGNNETLSFPFIKSRFLQYDEYLTSLAAKEFLSPRPESSLLYLDESYSQAILLSNLLMLDSELEPKKKESLQPFKDYVGIEDVDTFRLVIRTDIEINPPKTSNDREETFSNFSGTTQQDISVKPNLLQNIDLKGNNKKDAYVTSYIEKLKRCATTWYEIQNVDYFAETGYVTGDYSRDSSYLYLDFKVNKATKKAFQFHFENDPLKLFELFKLLLVLDAYKISTESKKRIYSTQNIFLSEDTIYRPEENERVLCFKNFKIRKEEVPHSIFTKELSDGEHQFLHTLGLCLLFKGTRSLFLFDEPETHFNPDWKAKFITSLRNCFNIEEDKKNNTMREMLMTTHSSYLISDSEVNFVLLLKKGKDGDFKYLRPRFQTLGASINKITIEIFGAKITVGDYALSKLQAINDKLESGTADKNELLNELENTLGDSVEKILLRN